MTERNGLVLSCEPSLNAHIFIFVFVFFLQFVMFLFCFVLFLFLLIFQADTSLFLFHLIHCWKFNFTNFSHNYDNYSMFRDVPGCSGIFHVPNFIDDLTIMPLRAWTGLLGTARTIHLQTTENRKSGSTAELNFSRKVTALFNFSTWKTKLYISRVVWQYS